MISFRMTPIQKVRIGQDSEDSSDSEASTVRPMETELNNVPIDNNTNSNMLCIVYKRVSKEDVRAIEAHLDSLSHENVASDIQESSSLSISDEISLETQAQGDRGAASLQIGCLAQEHLTPVKSLAGVHEQMNAESGLSRNSISKIKNPVLPRPVSMEEVQDEGIGPPPPVTEKARSTSRERKPKSRVHFQLEDPSLLDNGFPATPHEGSVRELRSPGMMKEPITKATRETTPTTTSGTASKSGSTIGPLNATNLAKLTERTAEPLTTLSKPKSNGPLAKRRLDSIIADKSYISPSLYMQEV